MGTGEREIWLSSNQSKRYPLHSSHDEPTLFWQIEEQIYMLRN